MMMNLIQIRNLMLIGSLTLVVIKGMGLQVGLMIDVER